MKYRILGDSDCPLVEIDLDKNENVKIERGSMVYLSNVSIEGKLNSGKKGLGGVLNAIGRGITSGESMFITNAVGMSTDNKIGIAPSLPGKIYALEVEGSVQYRLNTGVFLACDDSVNYLMKSQSIDKAFFGGTGGIFVMETEGRGTILISAFGDLVELDVDPRYPLTIDNDHVVAWDKSLDYTIEIASGMFGFTTGEGLVNVFKGRGKVLVQTRNIASLAGRLSSHIQK